MVWASWAKRLKISVVIFDIVQFFLSLNHSVLTLILKHFGFSNYIIDFFSDYLAGRSTQYSWNLFFSGTCDTNVDIEQNSTHSLILLVFYIASFIYIFELRAQALNLNTSFLSFVDNSLLICYRKTYNTTLPELFNSYRVITDLIVLFGLVMEHGKSEIFYFSRIYNKSNPELDFSAIGTSTLEPKTYWKYLGFYFYCCLFFKKHICYYSTKVLL